jgi:TolA-binding protein
LVGIFGAASKHDMATMYEDALKLYNDKKYKEAIEVHP